MTIDSGWVRVLKDEAPDAFRSTYPFKGVPNVAYIDGMPLLMASERTTSTWDALLKNNFARHISRYFRWHLQLTGAVVLLPLNIWLSQVNPKHRLGCKAVVLAFDDYDRVPMAKSITQANRSKKKAPYEFGEGQQLPPTIPHAYNDKLSNRIFKRRVIDMVGPILQLHILFCEYFFATRADDSAIVFSGVQPRSGARRRGQQPVCRRVRQAACDRLHGMPCHVRGASSAALFRR